MTTYVDDFNRGSLGTDGPNGAPWEGDPSGWTITSNQLTTTGAADNQLVVDVGAADASVALTIGGNNNNHDIGILARWVDATHFVAVSVRPDVQQIILYTRNGGFSVAGWYSVAASANPTGKTLAVDIVGNDFTITFDGVVLGTISTSFQAGETRVGIWSYHSTITFDDFTITDDTVVVPELATGHLELDGGTLGAPSFTGPELATGHLNVVAPIGSFNPMQSWPDTEITDDFEREDVNPNADDYTYQGGHQWLIEDGEILPEPGQSMLIAYGGNQEVTVTVTRVDENESIFERAQTAGIVLGYKNVDNYIVVTLRAALGADIVEVTERKEGVNIDHGGWTVAGHVGTLSAHMWGDQLEVSWEGSSLGVVELTLISSGGAGLVAVHDPEAGIQVPRFGSLHIFWPAMAVPVPMGLAVHGGHLGSVADRPIAMGAAVRGPVVYGPRVSQPGTYVPPIVAKVFRLRDWLNPVVTLDQSFARTWQDQFGEAGSGSVTLLNDDPDLELINDGDVVRFELYGEAAFSFVITGREKTTIAKGEEHDEVTVLTGPGLLSWLTSSMLVYPARQPPPLINGPAFDRHIQGEPIEEDRVFSWASYAQLVDNDLYGPTVALGDMPEPLPEGWPEGVVATRIWVPEGDLNGPVYFRMGFSTSVPDCQIYIHTPLMDPVMAWLDGSLMYESEGGPDTEGVGSIGGSLSDIGSDDHVLTIRVEHVGGPAWLAVVGIGLDVDGEITGEVMGTADDWLAIAYPATPPPVTAGAVLGAVMGEMNSRRYNPQLALVGSIETDSDGNAWPPLPELSTKVGNTVWAFLQEIADHVEVWMGPNPLQLYAWIAGGRGSERNVTLHGPTDPHDPDSSNLRGLTHRRAT